MQYLDDQLCVQFYIKTRAIIRIHEKHLRPLGLTYPKALVLLALDEKSPCFIDEIATRLCLDTGTLTPLLKKLLADKYLEKKRDDKDERRVFVTLTSLGKGSLPAIKEAFEKTGAAVCLSLETKQMLLTNVKLINFMES